MEELVRAFAGYVALGLEALSILAIALGGLEAVYRCLSPLLGGQLTHANRREAYLSMARWLLLGLEFMLAADIVRSTIAPDWTSIGQLAAIAAIRTFLNFFLERDFEALEMKGEEASGPEDKEAA
ncbi:MAG: DUF1622 domain-containing protein [Arenimonas sp.]|nr:DUF1622 domain-containing protein [Arenimonas sp.]